MSVEDRAFFIAAGKSLEQVEAWAASIKAGVKAAKAWANDIGATQICWDNSRGLKAMMFGETPAPAGWVKNRRQPEWHVPSESRSKEAKAVRAKVQSLEPLSPPGGRHVAHDPNASGFGLTIWNAGAFRLGGKWIITQHKEVKEIPPDAIPIKRSEYMAMVEAEEEAKKSKGAAA